MPGENDEFLKQLLATFKVEAQEHVATIFGGLVQLEKSSGEDSSKVIEVVYRAAHSLKGAARAVSAVNIESVCQKLEGIFANLKRGEGEVTPDLLDSLHEELDSIREMLAVPEGTQSFDSGGANASEAEKEIRPRVSVATDQNSEAAQKRAEDTSLPDTVRISTARLDSLLLQTEELVLAKMAFGQHAQVMRRLQGSVQQLRARWRAIHADIRRLEAIVIKPRSMDSPEKGIVAPVKRLIEFMAWNAAVMESVEKEFVSLIKPFERDRRAFSSMLEVLLEEMKQVVMLPFSALQDLLVKLARDLSREQGKEVDFIFNGASIEVDRRILEEMKDPLIHLLRNSIDHGIETPDERERQGKPRRGTVTMRFSRTDSAKVDLQISDDGGGVDVERLKEVAIESGILTSEQSESLSEPEALDLMFRSGFSTSSTLTKISGRGLGLAIVQEKVEKLGGSISIQSRRGFGTAFLISLPLTVSTFRGIIVCVAEQRFVVPTAHIQAIVRLNSNQVKSVGSQQTIAVNGQITSLVRLDQVLGLNAVPGKGTPGWVVALVLNFGGERIAFAVDEVQQEQEVLLKKLGRQLVRVRNIAGATILGAGVVPILNVVDLMKSAAQLPSSTGGSSTVVSSPAQTVAKKRILIVDDSITTRTLLKNILESNGYNVETAVDGMDGLTRIKASQFALVVSDVEMPRMSGLDMTAKIRAEKRLAELPVILVTALESQEDRERGFDVGANAYLVKRRFDQSDLLEAIRRFV